MTTMHHAGIHTGHTPGSIATVASKSPGRPRQPAHEREVRPCPTPHLNPEQYIHLLACIEAVGGIATLDEISRALPRVPQPISAVLDLCDAGVLEADFEAAFDGDMRVWRADR